MISYEPFWKKTKESGITTYTLIKEYHISSGTIDRLRHNRPVNTTTLSDLCKIYQCPIEGIVKYVPDEEENTETKE